MVHVRDIKGDAMRLARRQERRHGIGHRRAGIHRIERVALFPAVGDTPDPWVVGFGAGGGEGALSPFWRVGPREDLDLVASLDQSRREAADMLLDAPDAIRRQSVADQQDAHARTMPVATLQRKRPVLTEVVSSKLSSVFDEGPPRRYLVSPSNPTPL